MTRTAGLVLAAGEGRRFSGKAPYVMDGERLVDRAVRVLRDGGCNDVVVVLGAWVGDVPRAVVVENLEWPTGMGSSLRAGLVLGAASRSGYEPQTRPRRYDVRAGASLANGRGLPKA